MIRLENEYLTVQINQVGAELVSVIDKTSHYEFMWQGDNTYWGRTAPVLFPIIGRLKDNQFIHHGQTYELSRHGFARDMEFTLQSATDSTASFYIKSNEETMKHYPFEFSFQISYILFQRSITVTYEILNPSTTEILYYSVGAHPAFNVSNLEVAGKKELDNVHLKFSPSGQYLELFLDKDGLVRNGKSKYTPLASQHIQYQDFKKDTLMYQINSHTVVTLIDMKNKAEIELKPRQMDFIAVWTPYHKYAPFVSVEAWAGIGDFDNASGKFSEKYGNKAIEPNGINTHDFTLTFVKK